MHAVFGAGLHGAVDLCVFPSRMRLRTPGRRHQHLADREPSKTVGPGQELLCHYPLDRRRQLGADLLLLVGREDVDDAVDRLGGVLSVQRGEDEVTCLGGGECRGNGLQVAISPMSITSGSWRNTCFKASPKPLVSSPTSRWLTTAVLWWWRYSMGSSTDMMWIGLVELMMSMSAASVVDLPEPVGPVTSTRPRRQVCKLAHGSRQAELFRREDLEWDGPEDGTQGVALLEHVEPEPSNAARHGKCPAPGCSRSAHVVSPTGCRKAGPGFRRVQHLEVLQRDEGAVDADHGGTAGSQVKVRTPGFDHLHEDLVDMEFGRELIGAGVGCSRAVDAGPVRSCQRLSRCPTGWPGKA